ncbi:MAG TPA: AAA family ATPase [Desulfobacterales bacterium]|nr:AAA family ATPase [Desulfobacterales bacterium]
MNKNMILEYEKLQNKLKKIVFDQGYAIDETINALIHMWYKPIEVPPKAIFSFLGPPDVGKIYLAKTVARFLTPFHAFKRFDMGRYSVIEEEGKLLGQKVAFEGTREGELTRFIKKNPRSIILFDEIEKAENQVQLALLDFITSDEPERGVDFRESIIVFTSSLGSGLYQNREFLNTIRENTLRAKALMMEAVSNEKKWVYDIVQSAIAPKMISAMSQNYIVLFNQLSLDSMVKIGIESLQRLSRHFIEKTNIELEYEDVEQLVKLMILTFAPNINAERIRRKIPEVLFNKVTEFVRATRIIPEKVIFTSSRQVKEFLDQVQMERGTLTDKITKKNETIEMEWKQLQRDNNVFFTADGARLEKLVPSHDLLPSERPVIEFSKIGFEDIAGNQIIKKTLRQIITVLKDPGLVKKFNIGMPKGLLIYGSKGVGKTMLGKAFAKEAELPFIYVSGEDLFDSSYIRRVYQKAKEFSPSLVFLDEIDMKGIVEGVYTNMPAGQLVMELDAVSSDPDEFIFTIATATNRDDVDSSIVAPGRVDTFVEVPELDKEARRFFIEKILEKPHDGKIDVDKVVSYISGMNGYDLQRIGKEAALYAIRNNLEFITEQILIEQINNIKYGYKIEKKHIRNLEEDLKKAAYHEAGHAVLSYILLPDIKIEQVTIAPRFESRGFVSYNVEDFPAHVSKEEIFNNICVMFAGRLANIKKFGLQGIDTGASNDLEQATSLSYVAIANLGMDDELGYVHVDTLAQNVNKQLFQQKLEDRINQWINDATSKAGTLIDKYWDKIEILASILLRKEIVDGVELEEIMKSDGHKNQNGDMQEKRFKE